MLRLAALSSSLFLVACAATHTNEVLVSDALDGAASPAPTAALETPPETALALESAPAALETGFVPAPALASLAAAPVEGEGSHGSRFTLKGGYWGSTEDELDDGYIFNASWMTFMSKILALELEIGYIDADGSDSGIDTDVWSVPIMVNGRLNVPVWILDLYGGLGVGTLYYDAEASGAVSGSEDGFLLGGNAFLGATINLADRISLGLEGKYYATEDIDDVDAGLNAYALMLTLGFSR